MIPYAHCFLKTDCISRSNIRNFNRRSEIFRQTSYRICRRTDALSASDREEKSGTYFADRNDRSIHESVRGTLQNRQVASVGFYMIYILLAALTVAAFDVVIQWVESGIRNITAFMGSVLSGLLSGSCGGEGKCDRSGIL